MKAIIVEDDYVVRQGIIHSIDWAENGIDICAEAFSGRDGYQRVAEHRPDIVITDIRMPVEDGLQLAGRIAREFPWVKVVILTGYDEFAYARKALQLGVSEYLLKPVNAEELLETVLRLKEKILQEQRALAGSLSPTGLFAESRSIVSGALLGRLVTGTAASAGQEREIVENLAHLDVHLPGAQYQVAVVAVDGFLFLTHDLDQRERAGLIQKIRDALDETLAVFCGACVFFDERDYLAAILNVDADADAYNALRKSCAALQKRFGFPVVAAVGGRKAERAEIPLSFQEALLTLRKRACRKGETVLAHCPEPDDVAACLWEFREEESSMVQALRLYKTAEIMRVLREFFDNAARGQVDLPHLKNACIRLIMIALSNLEEMSVTLGPLGPAEFDPLAEIERLHSIDLLSGWMESVFARVCGLLRETQKDKYSAVVKKALQFVQRHYREEIKIEHVVREVCISPNYFSKIFKAQTGMNFVDYLNKFRVEQSKALLGDLTLKIYHVAEHVGYQNYKYYSQIFSKYEGCSPMDYRNRVCG